jgi:hypothetical protein
MCRNKEERKERCSCDTSEARRLRRNNRSARQLFAGLVLKVMQPNFLIPVATEEPVTAANVKQNIASLNGLLELLDDPNYNTTSVLVEYDNRLNSIGAAIEHISETEYGAPTDEEFREQAEMVENAFVIYKKEALATGRTEDEAHTYAEQRAMDDFGGQTLENIGNMLEQRNEAIRNALIDVGVKFADPNTLKSTSYSDQDAVNSLKEALKYYPQSWVDASNAAHDEHPLYVKNSDIRAHYDHVPSKIEHFELAGTYSELIVNEDSDFFVGEDAGMSTAIHEFAHRVEYCVVGVTASEEIFLKRRSGHLPNKDGKVEPEELTEIYPNVSNDEEIDEDENEDPKKKRKEMGYKDNFPDHYMGKVYENDCREILSTGMESLFAGMYGGFTGIFKYGADPDYKKFILGLIASTAVNTK